LELMKKRSEQVFLFWGEWCRVLYNSDQDHFRFIRCSKPIMDADRSRLIATTNLTYLARGAIHDLMVCDHLVWSSHDSENTEKGRGGV